MTVISQNIDIVVRKDCPFVGVEYIGQQGGYGEASFEKALPDADVHHMGEWYRELRVVLRSGKTVLHLDIQKSLAEDRGCLARRWWRRACSCTGLAADKLVG